jgi:hypothetical protein
LRPAAAAADEARNKKRRRQVLDGSSLREELQGSEVEVYWPDDATWWAAKLTKVGGALEPGPGPAGPLVAFGAVHRPGSASG